MHAIIITKYTHYYTVRIYKKSEQINKNLYKTVIKCTNQYKYTQI